MQTPDTIGKCMKTKVIAIAVNENLEKAISLFKQWHIGTLPVVDHEQKLVGILLIRDLLGLVMPDFISLVEDFDFVADFGAIELRLPSSEALKLPVNKIMQPPTSIMENCGLMRAFSVLHHQHLADLPVISADGRLIGITSRVDIEIGRASCRERG